MLKFSKPALLVFFFSFGACAGASNDIYTEIRKSDQSWTVTYRTTVPVEQLAFKRNPNRSRADRWKAISAQYQIVHKRGTDLVRRLDGKLFSETTFALTPSYTPLPKEYAPFSPFSDGGMLIHSGRFFACPEVCESKHKEWQISLVAPERDTIILNGNAERGRVEWWDDKSGRKIYVGPQQPDSSELFISVIDPALPEDLKSQLHQFLPLLFTEYAKYLHQPVGKPMLFASYDASHEGGQGRQGGVLPDQIFMHWYGKNTDSRTGGKDVLWFFSHEVAHLFQGTSGQMEESGHAWIQEGAAEYMAGLVMKSLIPETAAWVDARFSGVETPCLNGLKEASLLRAAEGGRHWLYYTCGLFIHDAIARKARDFNESVTYFDIWASFRKRVEAGETASFEVFMRSLQPFVHDRFIHNLEEFVVSSGDKSAHYFSTLSSKRSSPYRNGMDYEYTSRPVSH